MLPAAGKHLFLWEISCGLIQEGESVRTFGRLSCYDMSRSEAELTAPQGAIQHRICISTKSVEPFQAQIGSMYMALGEIERAEGEVPVLRARVLTCVDGINLPLLECAVQEQRKYFQSRTSETRTTSH
ncbi:CST complex subunit TEN1 [Microcaecilia unicolor]|uniref:CST complex subunit TEN1 n=1 Tax=Microcaecilia unicolor TaxID=1415580 RepID=A0A6P7YM11_9AMPH|nr:CST complex subunit TEN1 [Microcaecilia unicolor]XP_030064089.1 CST complex subunit TEN1 [Microcaecilia unicolor]XP_030064090.1 CST complex subunit TEN1 [Microcaecilia unicolor]XP_030064091.1 CST complex subunit TEN1 [Microcaecilia unicolor]